VTELPEGGPAIVSPERKRPIYNQAGLREDHALMLEMARDMTLPMRARRWAAGWASRILWVLDWGIAPLKGIASSGPKESDDG
jgi:hypothetical protein